MSAETVCFLLGIMLLIALAVGWVLRRLSTWMDSPLSEFDVACSHIDVQAHEDELAAQWATRPHGNVVIGPWDRGDVA